MNPLLHKLHPYPFQKFGKILGELEPCQNHSLIRLSIGEPQHETPKVILDALSNNLADIAYYPTTQGSPELRSTIKNWIEDRFGMTGIDPDHEILPVNGTREALFALSQVVLPPNDPDSVVVMPNPFYQIYEGATLLSGATPKFLNLGSTASPGWQLTQLPAETWNRTKLLYVCNPGNPTGHVMTLSEWEELFEFSDKYGFIIASDECYSEIYFEEGSPPLGAITAAKLLGRDLTRLIVFGSLSKRSNVPGMRSGFVCGDSLLLKQFLLYRTYHGSAMSPAVQKASIAAWSDETHVIVNRTLYRNKFDSFINTMKPHCSIQYPSAGFYVWLKTPIDDVEFAKKLYTECSVVVLPGSLVAREAHDVNPGKNHVRIALVAEQKECDEAARRMVSLLSAGFD
ncbi:succinyldiaminopimelate transaminase [Burkholderiales bacterium]|nr:succinyldiaminopimelate transaminase [Burkholderiales bacterium]